MKPHRAEIPAPDGEMDGGVDLLADANASVGKQSTCPVEFVGAFSPCSYGEDVEGVVANTKISDSLNF